MPEPQPPLLSRLPAFEGDELFVVIETPKNSRNKYDYDEAVGAFRLKAVMPEGMAFPYDFGFIPSTLGEDGDPLDILVLLDAPVVVGCVLSARLIGVIEAEQRAAGKPWLRNDRLLAVATHARTHEHVHRLDDLRPNLLGEIEAFFGQYNALSGREFRPVGRSGPDQARALVEHGRAAFQQHRNRK
ncbi:MAG: inorganic diphosphatase [Acetobacteraceae bacterium]|nr:inorganic diphosphatase [Acetobacteraceae bacterium]